MLNQFNQFICIQTRNAGNIAVGCTIDGLFSMIGGLVRRDYRPLHAGDPSLLQGDFGSLVSSSLIKWLQGSHRKRHWCALVLSGLQFQRS